MLQVSQLNKNFGLEPILSNINFTINKGDRFGLVGINGTGKTTLIKIITGEEVADKGSVTFFPPNLRVGYLPQGIKVDQYDTINSYFGNGIRNLPSIEDQLAQLSNSLANHPENVEQQAQFDLILSQINLITNIHYQAPEVLNSLGLGQFNLDTPIQHLSGGQKTRLM
ncbi:MAG TPA: ATP-binding cassette domain-containing protein, partial [Anaerolineaceae bacterium]|nr:ATP-binding cassette domain-containing protein [Anaerolineaceae bacterium]